MDLEMNLQLGKNQSPGWNMYLQEIYGHFLIKTEKVAESVTELMDRYSPGDSLDMEEAKEKIIEALEKGEDDEKIRNSSALEMNKWLRFYSMLYMNDLIRKTDDGEIIMQQHTDPDELCITFPAEIVEQIEDDQCREYGLTSKMAIISRPVCNMTFGADAIFKLDPEEIDTLFTDIAFDSDRYETFMDNYSSKKMIVEWIMEYLSDHGTVTAMEIFEILSDNMICTTDSDTEITIETDLEYVKEVLSDMRKAKLIKKTGGVFKIV